MIIGAHTLWYSTQPEADRAFLRDVIGLKTIDIGHGWLIFAMPPSEAAVHPADSTEGNDGDLRLLGAHVYFMCDDLDATLKDLAAKGVSYDTPQKQQWGIVSHLRLPSGGAIGIYQPLHKMAISS